MLRDPKAKHSFESRGLGFGFRVQNIGMLVTSQAGESNPFFALVEGLVVHLVQSRVSNLGLGFVM